MDLIEHRLEYQSTQLFFSQNMKLMKIILNSYELMSFYSFTTATTQNKRDIVSPNIYYFDYPVFIPGII